MIRFLVPLLLPLLLSLLVGCVGVPSRPPSPPRLTGDLAAVPTQDAIVNYAKWTRHYRWHGGTLDDACYIVDLRAALLGSVPRSPLHALAITESRVENGMDSHEVILSWGGPDWLGEVETSPWGEVDRWGWGHPEYNPPRSVTMRNGLVVWWSQRK